MVDGGTGEWVNRETALGSGPELLKAFVSSVLLW